MGRLRKRHLRLNVCTCVRRFPWDEDPRRERQGLGGALLAEFSSQRALWYEPTTVPLTGAGPSVQRSLMVDTNSPNAGSSASGL